VNAAVERTATLDPALAFALSAAHLLDPPKIPPSLNSAASGYIRRTFDRGETAIAIPKKDSLFRVEELQKHLPQTFLAQFDTMHHEGLDAPVAGAAAALGLVSLSAFQMRRCKAAVAEDPVYFAEGFGAFLAQHHTGD
jgi:hypothetical protein